MFPHEIYERFELANVDEAECKPEFRVEKSDLPQHADALRIPQIFKCDQRSECDAQTASVPLSIQRPHCKIWMTRTRNLYDDK